MRRLLLGGKLGWIIFSFFFLSSRDKDSLAFRTNSEMVNYDKLRISNCVDLYLFIILYNSFGCQVSFPRFNSSTREIGDIKLEGKFLRFFLF